MYFLKEFGKDKHFYKDSYYFIVIKQIIITRTLIYLIETLFMQLYTDQYPTYKNTNIGLLQNRWVTSLKFRVLDLI